MTNEDKTDVLIRVIVELVIVIVGVILIVSVLRHTWQVQSELGVQVIFFVGAVLFVWVVCLLLAVVITIMISVRYNNPDEQFYLGLVQLIIHLIIIILGMCGVNASGLFR
ncbi:hypothetical protein [Weissella cibaria]|uniref:Uncharacterized protein n=1 Tax=Weissella cibaria TaxID=137591 RepID=A0A0D1K441_9LACO|nr:hypothetical protein [Weissella cibaria]KIU19774.1 hypothetical protein QX99_01795 [Weissella cibaria]MDV8929026.1 hypothetical protein [Weissella cibaria]